MGIGNFFRATALQTASLCGHLNRRVGMFIVPVRDDYFYCGNRSNKFP